MIAFTADRLFDGMVSMFGSNNNIVGSVGWYAIEPINSVPVGNANLISLCPVIRTPYISITAFQVSGGATLINVPSSCAISCGFNNLK